MAATKSKSSLDDILAKAFESEGLDRYDLLGDKGFIPTGNLALDYILGGGLPCGRTAEFYGPSQCGKTTLSAMIAAQVQQRGERVVYLDFEQALDETYLNALGVDTRGGLFDAPPVSSLEAASELVSAASRTGEVRLFVFDSVPAMQPKSVADSDEDPSRTAAMERARLLGALLTRMNPILARTGASAIFINHIRDVIDTGWVPPGMGKRTTTPGGTALKYYSSVRVEFKIAEKFKSEKIDPLTGEIVKEPHSVISNATVTKNKVSAPFQTAKLYLELGKGFSNVYSAMSVLTGNNTITKSGAFYRFPDDLYHPNMTTGPKGSSFQGLQKVLEVADLDEEWSSKLITKATAALPQERRVVSIPSLEDDGERPVVEEPVSAPEDAPEPSVSRSEAFAPVRSDPPAPREWGPQVPVGNSGQAIRFTAGPSPRG